MLKVLHVLSALDGGGVESMLKSYYEQIEDEDVVFDFVVHGSKVGMLEDYFLSKGCRIFHVPSKRQNFCKYLHEIKNILSTNDYDVVHCHQGEKGYLVLRYAKKIGKSKCVCHAHGSFQYLSLFKRIFHKLRLRILEKFTDVYCACSHEAAINTFGDQICKKYPVKIIYNAFNLEKFYYSSNDRKEIRLSNNVAEEDFLLGMIGRLSIEKNHKFIFDILKLIDNSCVKLMVVGEGPLSEELKDYAKNINLIDRIIFIGKVQDPWRYYSAFDTFLFPSLFEGLGIALVEAQISGLPCIVSERISNDAIISKESVSVVELVSENWVNAINSYKNVKINRGVSIDKFTNYDIRIQYVELLQLYWGLLK